MTDSRKNLKSMKGYKYRRKKIGTTKNKMNENLIVIYKIGGRGCRIEHIARLLNWSMKVEHA